jgi:hypothetical protein
MRSVLGRRTTAYSNLFVATGKFKSLEAVAGIYPSGKTASTILRMRIAF